MHDAGAASPHRTKRPRPQAFGTQTIKSESAVTRVTMNDADTRCKSHKQSLYEVLRDVNDADKQMEATKRRVLCVV